MDEYLSFLNAVLIILLVSVAITDLVKGKIYNIQTYPAIVLGFFIGFMSNGLPGVLDSFLGLIVGLAILLLFFLMGGMGAGDVKLLGAIGALKGVQFVTWSAFYTALVGGAMAIAYIIWTGTFKKTVSGIYRIFIHFLIQPKQLFNDPQIWVLNEGEKKAEPATLPYGLSISLGSLYVLFS